MSDKKSKPNFLFIVTDQQSLDTISAATSSPAEPAAVVTSFAMIY